MTKEQEVIKRLNRFKTIKVLYGNIFAMHTEQLRILQEDIETALNIIKENSAEIQQKNTELAEKNAEIEKKDKQINFMANFINDNTPYTKDTKELENEEGIRTASFTTKYFERKSKEC